MQPIQTRINKIENSNVGMIADRLEKLESSLKYVIRKVDQLDKTF